MFCIWMCIEGCCPWSAIICRLICFIFLLCQREMHMKYFATAPTFTPAQHPAASLLPIVAFILFHSHHFQPCFPLCRLHREYFKRPVEAGDEEVELHQDCQVVAWMSDGKQLGCQRMPKSETASSLRKTASQERVFVAHVPFNSCKVSSQFIKHTRTDTHHHRQDQSPPSSIPLV